jgi:hypothetical protein
MNRTSNVRKQNSSGHFSPKSPDCLPDGSGSLISFWAKTCAVSELVTHYRMHTYRPGKPSRWNPKRRRIWPTSGCNAMEEEEESVLMFPIHARILNFIAIQKHVVNSSRTKPTSVACIYWLSPATNCLHMLN